MRGWISKGFLRREIERGDSAIEGFGRGRAVEAMLRSGATVADEGGVERREVLLGHLNSIK